MSNVNLKTDFKNGDKLYAEQLNNNFELIKEAFAKGATGDVVWQDGTTVKFRRYVTTDIEQLPILDGAIIYDIQKGRNYIDYDGERIQVGSAGNEVVIGEESEITEDTKLIIEQEFIDNIGSEVVNSLEGNETNKAPSVSVVNEALEKKKDIYTNEEVEIGTWIDGKPIYRKVVQFTIGNINTSNQYRLGIAAETIVSWKGYFKNSSNQYWAIDNFYVDGSNVNGIWVFVDATNDILYEQHNYSYPTGRQATFTIEYTKPTD